MKPGRDERHLSRSKIDDLSRLTSWRSINDHEFRAMKVAPLNLRDLTRCMTIKIFLENYNLSE